MTEALAAVRRHIAGVHAYLARSRCHPCDRAEAAYQLECLIRKNTMLDERQRTLRADAGANAIAQ